LVPATPAVVTSSSSGPVGEFRSLHQALRAPRADAVRAFGSHGGANGGGERLPVTGDAAHTFTPRALRDPDSILTMDTAGRHCARARGMIGGTVVQVHVERRAAGCRTLRAGPCFGGRPGIVSDGLQG
jgi:hypothetical protein